MSQTSPANADQAAHWNETAGPAWVEMQAMMDRLLQPFEALLVERAFPGGGGRVLDVGCGAGATTLAMARRLGPAGLCLGLDISEPLVAAATARAEAEGLASARFVTADAQTYDLSEEAFDAVISRFGVMFFEAPEAAFENLRRGARAGAELAFVCWRGPLENPYFTAPMAAAASFLPPTPAPDPDAPGQFAFADPERVKGVLARAGWRDVQIDPLDTPLALERQALLRLLRRVGPLSGALETLDAAARAKVEAAVEGALEPFVNDGVARFTAACWWVTARAP